MNLRPLRPELPAAATISVAKHVRAAPNQASWRVAVVVSRYFVAVLLAQPTRAQSGHDIRHAGRHANSRHEWRQIQGTADLVVGEGPLQLDAAVFRKATASGMTLSTSSYAPK